MNKGLLRRLSQSESPQYVQLLQRIVDTTLHGHRTLFTRGDLQPKNIVVERTGSYEDGCPAIKIMLIDWEVAGWYPEYWEFCSATILCRWKPAWLEVAPDILNPCPLEYLMMQVVYSTVFYRKDHVFCVINDRLWRYSDKRPTRVGYTCVFIRRLSVSVVVDQRNNKCL
ncbi:hypothetical protein BDV24DRAFT_127098, partial [Aspergillus arachidicola]